MNNESFRRECCDRCGEWNDSADVRMVEHGDGSGEIVCKPCLKDEQRSEREFNEEFEGEEYRMLLVPTAHDEPPLSFELFRYTYCMTTTNNTFAALPASEETLDLSRDAAYASPVAIVVGDSVRVQTGNFAVCSGVVSSVTGEQVTVMLRVFGHLFPQSFHWTNLKKVG